MNLLLGFRKDKKMNQKQFSQKTGASANAISRTENGESINLSNACAICNAFPDELYIKELSIHRKLKK